MADDVSVEVDLSKLGAEINGFGAELASQAERTLGKVGDDIVDAVKSQLRQSPPSSGKPTKARHDSRAQAAQGVAAKVVTSSGRYGLDIKSDASRMARGREAFPAAYGLARWSHPVFGNPAARVSQRGRPYFERVIRTFEGRTEDALRAAGQAALDTIKGE